MLVLFPIFNYPCLVCSVWSSLNNAPVWIPTSSPSWLQHYHQIILGMELTQRNKQTPQILCDGAYPHPKTPLLFVVCVLVERMEWFHLDFRHLGGNLLVNRLVHELGWVHLLLCKRQHCGQFRFLRSPPKTRDWQREGLYSVEKCVSVFPNFSGSWKFPRSFLAHSLHIWRSGQLPIVTKLMQFTRLCNVAQHCWSRKYNIEPRPIITLQKWKKTGCFGSWL